MDKPPADSGDAKDGGRRSPFVQAPQLSLPVGGGAIRSMGEKFTTNPVTGTASLSLPIPASPGRAGFTPQLSLTYNSGGGNDVFGMGWSLDLPAITRKTDKGLPRYLDAEESDVFVLSGAEDLVPVLRDDGTRFRDDTSAPGYVIERYRPRIEGLFARVERWTRVSDGDVHWRSLSRDNILTLYGRDENSRIAKAGEPTHVFSWRIAETRDDRGNAMDYVYKAEDATGVDLSLAREHNRGDALSQARRVNRHVKRVRYGNRLPFLTAQGERPRFVDQAMRDAAGWMFELIFDYGEHDELTPKPSDAGDWLCRHDPFSSYRSGFELRTYRLCQRILMFHHFAAETGIGNDCLTRSMDVVYRADPARGDAVGSFVASISQSGYRRQDGGYLKRSLPALELDYSEAVIGTEVHDLGPDNLAKLPGGVDGSQYRWLDLDGEGLSGVLSEQGTGWYYTRNESALLRDAATGAFTPRFAPIEPAKPKPAGEPLGSGAWQFLDLTGDGRSDLVALGGATPGFFTREQDHEWGAFRSFRSLPNVDWNGAGVKFVDLTGDGNADVLIAADDVLVWHESLAEDGFGPWHRIVRALDEERGPRVVFAEATQTIYLADMSGDGLTDIVRVRNGEICYWPNLGYGRFGSKVTMDGAPRFDRPDQFDPKRVRLADVDGSGTADVIYLGRSQTRLWYNQAGNGFGDAIVLGALPPVDNIASVMTVDLFGNGTTTLLWSSPLAPRHAMKYLNLMASGKPHLLTGLSNNLGAEKRITYAPSTHFYLKDKYEGRPWIGQLPFPVQTVERVEIFDRIAGSRFVTRYAYHHGYFDGPEREFRGFGMVEQWDTEVLAALTPDGAPPAWNDADDDSHAPPIHTKTWFHTGMYLGREQVSDFFAGLRDGHDIGEYYREPAWRTDDAQARAHLLDDTVMPPGLSVAEEREACRALKGAMLRQEVYALDGTGTPDYPSGQPYMVKEQNFTIAVVQRRAGQRHAVFFTHPREAIQHHYERNADDPRIGHTLTLKVDGYGAVLRSLDISYPRADVPGRLPEQAATHMLLTLNRVANEDAATDWRRIGQAVEARTYEVVKPPTAALRFGFNEVAALLAALIDPVSEVAQAAKTLPYGQWDWRSAWNPVAEPGGAAHSRLRLIEHLRTLYRPNDFGAAAGDVLALLPLGGVDSLALAGQTYRLAFPTGLIGDIYARPLLGPGGEPAENLLPVPASVLGGGGYVDLDQDGQWWIPSGRMFLSPDAGDTPALERVAARAHFFLPRRFRDPFHTAAVPTETHVDYDAYDLLVAETRDALGNRVTAGARDAGDIVTTPGNDYRVLKATLVADANRNRRAVAFDALGFVAGSAVMGKPPPDAAEGDALDGFAADLDEGTAAAHLADPLADPAAILGQATTRLVYDLFAYQNSKGQARPQPPVIYTLARETHAADPVPAGGIKYQHSFSYSDGFGREIQKKVLAEAGPVPLRDAGGAIMVGADGRPQMSAATDPRWVGSGWTVFNNKLKPVRQYEPFFSDTHQFDADVRIGVSPIQFYDPMERVVAVLHPDHSWSKTVFGPWSETGWDASDTTGLQPQNDADVKGFFVFPDGTPRLDASEYLPTWHGLRTDPAQAALAALRWPDARSRAAEAAAADLALVHAGTPGVTHSDSLGRAVLTVTHNRAKYSNAAPQEELAETHTILDIENNIRAVIDAKGRSVVRHSYDMLGHRIHQASMEAGERWMLDDATGKPWRAWDSRAHAFETTYDALRRPVDSIVDDGGQIVFLRRLYGESAPNATANNLRGKPFQVFDQAGVETSATYDFKGNLLSGSRQLVQTVDAALDWAGPVPLEAEIFGHAARYDALDRATEVSAPDGSIIRHGFNAARLLRTVDVNLQGEMNGGARLWTPFLVDVDYDAKGNRTRVDYATREATLISTRYAYDWETFRLVGLYTRRGVDPATRAGIAFDGDSENPVPPPDTIAAPETAPAGKSSGLQNLHYTYDPSGNVTAIRDDAQQTVYFHNKRVEPSATFTYDALYRLIEATGREHLGQAGGVPTPNSYNDRPRIGIALSASDGNALGLYLQRYVYDTVGNFQSIAHLGTHPAHPGWTRTYSYAEASQLEPGRMSNRLTMTAVGAANEVYSTSGDGYDPHGNMLHMPQLQALQWDFKDQLRMTRRQAVANDDADGLVHQGERTWYVYDSGGRRVRKVTFADAGPVKEERIYLGGFEIYRRYGADPLERQTLLLEDGARRMALVETRTQGSEPGVPAQLVRYQFGNHLGSASLELDDHADIISYEEYTPYGSTSFQAVRSQTEAPKRYRFSGKERDDESGLYYHGARYYAPWLGRWVSADPVGIADGVCLYAYGGANPVKFVDPTGTTITVSANTATQLPLQPLRPGQRAVTLQTSQRQAEETFLRDIRVGLPSAEQSLFTIDQTTHQLQFSGDRKKLSTMSGFTQLLVGQIDSKKSITILPTILGAANSVAAASLTNGPFMVAPTGATRGALVELRMNYAGGIPGSTKKDDAAGTIFVAYVTGATQPQTSRDAPGQSGWSSAVSATLKDYFFQGNISQTLTHELAAHVEGTLRGEPNQDGHFGQSQAFPGGSASLLTFRQKSNSGDPRWQSVLQNTSLAPFARSLKLEREVLAQLHKNFTRVSGGDPDKRKAYVELIERALANKRKDEESDTIDEFTSNHAYKSPASFWPPPITIGGKSAVQ